MHTCILSNTLLKNILICRINILLTHVNKQLLCQSKRFVKSYSIVKPVCSYFWPKKLHFCSQRLQTVILFSVWFVNENFYLSKPVCRVVSFAQTGLIRPVFVFVCKEFLCCTSQQRLMLKTVCSYSLVKTSLQDKIMQVKLVCKGLLFLLPKPVIVQIWPPLL